MVLDYVFVEKQIIGKYIKLFLNFFVLLTIDHNSNIDHPITCSIKLKEQDLFK